MHFIKEIIQLERRGFAALLAFDQCGAQPLDLQFLLFKQPQAGATTSSEGRKAACLHLPFDEVGEKPRSTETDVPLLMSKTISGFGAYDNSGRPQRPRWARQPVAQDGVPGSRYARPRINSAKSGHG